MRKYQNRVIVPARNRAGRDLPNHFQSTQHTTEKARLGFAEMWSAVRRGKWIILLTCVLTAAGIAAYTETLPLEYETTSTLNVDTKPRITPGIGESPSRATQRSIGEEIGVLTYSTEIAKGVISGLMQAADSSGNYPAFPILLDEDAQRRDTMAIRKVLMDRVSFGVPGEGILTITATGSSPVEAAAIANLFAREYERYSTIASRAGLKAKKKFVQEQQAKFWSQLNDIQRQWEAFAQGKKVYTLGMQGELLVAELNGLQAQRDALYLTIQQELEMLELQEKDLKAKEAALPSLAEQLTTTRVSTELQNKITALDQKIAQLQVQAEQYYMVDQSLRGNESTVPELDAIISQIQYFTEQRQGFLDQYIAEVADSPQFGGEGVQLSEVVQLRSAIDQKRLTIQGQRQRLDILNQKIGTYDSKIAALPRQAVELQQLQREKGRIEGLYNVFSGELISIRIAEEAEIGYVSIIQNAGVPSVPVRPNKVQNIILGVLLGLGFGVGLAFAKGALDNRLRSPEDFQTKGLSLLGVIPSMETVIKSRFRGRESIELEGRPVSTKLLTLHDPYSPITENYRLVRTKLHGAPSGSDIQVILITSPEMADGKTVTAMNLAIAIAQGGRRTLLIDADLRRPNAHRLLGLTKSPGLAQVLTCETDLDAVLQQSNIPNLSFIGAGEADIPAPELFSAPVLAKTLTELRESFDTIIMDSPPVLAVTDPVMLAIHADATILVTSAEKTDSRALDAARQVLEAVGVRVGGVILNRYNSKENGYSYGYTYSGYSYSSKEVA